MCTVCPDPNPCRGDLHNVLTTPTWHSWRWTVEQAGISWPGGCTLPQRLALWLMWHKMQGQLILCVYRFWAPDFADAPIWATSTCTSSQKIACSDNFTICNLLRLISTRFLHDERWLNLQIRKPRTKLDVLPQMTDAVLSTIEISSSCDDTWWISYTACQVTLETLSIQNLQCQGCFQQALLS